eukprot:519383-Pelagomonas_calceolata.AAC.3
METKLHHSRQLRAIPAFQSCCDSMSASASASMSQLYLTRIVVPACSGQPPKLVSCCAHRPTLGRSKVSSRHKGGRMDESPGLRQGLPAWQAQKRKLRRQRKLSLHPLRKKRHIGSEEL